MPKEQPCLREHSPCPSSSKNAKDKSNSIILMAIRDTKEADDSNRRGSSCSSEKDSGYSDCSDWQHTDGEDQRTNKGHFRPSEAGQPSLSDQNKEPGQKNPIRMPVRVNHPPLYIIKDMVLQKQPAMIQKRSQLLWPNVVRVSNHSASSHVILFEQPRFLPANFEHHKASSRTSDMTGKKTNVTHLPILKSYPSIAPHPSKKPPDKSVLNQEYQNLSKRVCTEHKTDGAPAARGEHEQHLSKQPNLTVSHSGLLCSSSTSYSLSSPTPTITSSVLGSSLMVGHATSSHPTANRVNKTVSVSSRHRRFLNTVEILKQSGLLDITLRTKELLRQSNATEQDISQLRQHTELLCQAANSPSLSLNGTTAWEHLHQVMAESGSYPNLKIQQKLQGSSQLDFASQQESIPTGVNRPQAAESLVLPPSCLLASTPEQTCTKASKKPEAGDESSDRVRFMSPDSSTD